MRLPRFAAGCPCFLSLDSGQPVVSACSFPPPAGATQSQADEKVRRRKESKKETGGSGLNPFDVWYLFCLLGIFFPNHGWEVTKYLKLATRRWPKKWYLQCMCCKNTAAEFTTWDDPKQKRMPWLKDDVLVCGRPTLMDNPPWENNPELMSTWSNFWPWDIYPTMYVCVYI